MALYNLINNTESEGSILEMLNMHNSLLQYFKEICSKQ